MALDMDLHLMNHEEVCEHNMKSPIKYLICPMCRKQEAEREKSEDHPGYMRCKACGFKFLA